MPFARWWQDWFGSPDAETPKRDPLTLARESLAELLDDQRLPGAVRDALGSDYDQVKGMLDKLEHGHVHIAAFGRVSTGKSSLLNALIGEPVFATSPLHGETKHATMRAYREAEASGVFLIDTPGLDEAFGEEREDHAREVVARADLIVFVVDADLTAQEHGALSWLAEQGRPVIIVLNKADRYTDTELATLLGSLTKHTDGLVGADNIVAAAAAPRPETVVVRDAAGNESTETRERSPDMAALRLRLWDVIEAEGKTLAALNASLFAADLTDRVGERVLAARQGIAEDVITMYCMAKGLAVAVNPIPVADLFAAAAIDVGMVVHLSRVYDLPLTQNEAGTLISTIATEAAALMGTVWAVHFVASALKVGTAGLSTIVTAGAQGAIAWYATLVVGEVASRYLAAGKSWGDAGPKRVVEDILASLDRDSVLAHARDELRARLSR
ncbi:MAG: GTP-binding protein [Pseudomonadota bacterium]